MTIRRPLYFIAAACTAAILIRFYFGWAAAGAGGALVALAAICLGKKETEEKGPRAGTCDSRAMTAMVLIAYLASLCNVWICDQGLAADPVLDFLDREVTVTGIVKDPQVTKDSQGRMMLRIDTEVLAIRGKEGVPRREKGNRHGRLLLSVPASSDGETAAMDPAAIYQALSAVPPGSRIRFAGTPKAPEPKRNPNCFDYRLYLKTKGIQATMRTEQVRLASWSNREQEAGASRPDVTMKKIGPTLGGRLFLLRERYLARIGAHAGGRTEAMIRAILFGEKGMLDDEIQELFRQNGTAHVLAVSGLHVGMIYGAMTLVWDQVAKWFPGLLGARKGRRFLICTGTFFTGYAFLAGFSPSVVRAVCMVLLHAFASMTGRRYDLNCAAFAVGIAALFHNPYLVFQAGFQMSFLAILTLGLITPYIHRIYSGALVGSMAIQIGLGPYMACQFNVLPTLAVFINVPVIFLTGLLVPAGLFGMMLPAALPMIPELFDQVLSGLCIILVRMNELCHIDRITSLTCPSPPVSLLAVYYLGLLVFASEEGRLLILRRRKAMLRRLAAGVVIASIVFGQAADDGFRQAQMVFVDVGQGDCMHIRSGRADYLIDGGGSRDYAVGEKTLKPYLLKNGVGCIDGAFVTHLHTDHYQGICELAKAGMVRRLFLYDGNRVKEAQVCEETGLKPDQLTYLRQGQRVDLPGGGSVEVLWPEQKPAAEYEQMVANEADENASSLIMRVEVSGVTMLATGDLGEEGEGELLRRYGGGTIAADDSAAPVSPLHADVLKVGHHGSKTSSSDGFLDAVRPTFAVIQVGKNNMYGHPTPETLQRLETRGIPVWRNDLQGAIGLHLRDGKVKALRTMIKEP